VGRSEIHSTNVIDLNYLLPIVIAIICQSRYLLEKSGIRGSYFIKAAVHNILRRIPFLDTGIFIKFIEQHGIPILQFNDEYSPPGKTYETLIQLQDLRAFEPTPSKVGIEEGLKILVYVFNSFGLPFLAVVGEDDEAAINDSLIHAGERAKIVGQNRRIFSG